MVPTKVGCLDAKKAESSVVNWVAMLVRLLVAHWVDNLVAHLAKLRAATLVCSSAEPLGPHSVALLVAQTGTTRAECSVGDWARLRVAWKVQQSVERRVALWAPLLEQNLAVHWVATKAVC